MVGPFDLGMGLGRHLLAVLTVTVPLQDHDADRAGDLFVLQTPCRLLRRGLVCSLVGRWVAHAREHTFARIYNCPIPYNQSQTNQSASFSCLLEIFTYLSPRGFKRMGERTGLASLALPYPEELARDMSCAFGIRWAPWTFERAHAHGVAIVPRRRHGQL